MVELFDSTMVKKVTLSKTCGDHVEHPRGVRQCGIVSGQKCAEIPILLLEQKASLLSILQELAVPWKKSSRRGDGSTSENRVGEAFVSTVKMQVMASGEKNKFYLLLTVMRLFPVWQFTKQPSLAAFIFHHSLLRVAPKAIILSKS